MLQQSINQLLNSQVQCVLATQNAESLAQHLMAYAFSENLNHIDCISLQNTQKVNNLKNNPNVSILWDNRTGNTSDHTEGVCLSAVAEARILKPDHTAFNQSEFIHRNPNLEALLSNPECVVLRFTVKKYIWVEGYTKVETFIPQQ